VGAVWGQVCGGPALSLFRTGEELELLISGVPQLDFEDLQTVASYQGDYNQEHATVKALWFTLHAFSLDEKKQFLKFTTGCDRSDFVTLPASAGDPCSICPNGRTCVPNLGVGVHIC
jgi:ubiquitin-protein ligase E3 A